MKLHQALLIALMALTPCGVLRADSPTVTPERYRELIFSAYEHLQAAAKGQTPPAEATRFLSPLTHSYFVQSPSGGIQTTPLFEDSDLRLLRGKAARVREEAMRDGLQRLNAAKTALVETAPDSTGRTEEILRRELASSDYRTPPLLELLRQAMEWLNRVLSDLLGGQGAGAVEGLKALAYAVTAVVACLVIYLLWMALSRIGLLRASRPAQPASASQEEPAAPEDALARARALWEQAEFLQAMRMVYRAALLRLHEAGEVRLAPGMTNREVLRRLQKPELKQAMRPATDLFDERFYHQQSASADDYQSMLGFYKQVMDGL